MKDRFFDTDRCERCGAAPLLSRQMSWFTDQALCGMCSDTETFIKADLRAKGIDTDRLEGCGYVPDPKTFPNPAA